MLLVSPAVAQDAAREPAKPGPRPKTEAVRRADSSKGKPAGAKPEAKKPAPEKGQARPAPPVPARKKSASAPSPEELVERLLTAWFTRHPDQAFTRGWPGARALSLGSFGVNATLDWSDALEEAQRDLAAFVLDTQSSPAVRAQRQALADWIAAEELELSRSLVTQDPSGYLQRAYRTLLALVEAGSIDEGVRTARLTAVLGELPGYLADARASLSAPRQEWVELALQEIADLEELILGLDARATPARPVDAATLRTPEREPRTPALRALTEFRAWLLELDTPVGEGPARLRAGDFARLLALASGAELELGAIEAAALRDIARADLPHKRPGPDALDLETIAKRAWTSSTRALELAQDAQLLGTTIYPRSIEFTCEESLRTRPESAWLRQSSRDTLTVWLAAPSTGWSVNRARTRTGALQPRSQAALGIRHGLVGEALYARHARASQRALAAFVGNRAVQEGLGLYALDWVRRIDWVENPLADDAELARELDRLRVHEAARLLAAIELHAEGLSLAEAAQAFTRRTGVDGDTATAEVLEARRDPLHGVGYLGWLELVRLERGLADDTHGKRGGIRLVLASVLAHPELTPARILPLAKETLAKSR